MAMQSVFCAVNRRYVTAVTDLEGAVTRLICPEYEESTGMCRQRARGAGGGPLSELIERLDSNTLDRRSTRCNLVE